MRGTRRDGLHLHLGGLARELCPVLLGLTLGRFRFRLMKVKMKMKEK
jgi:hypothetical protein